MHEQNLCHSQKQRSALHTLCYPCSSISFSFSFSSRWHRSSRKGPYALRPVFQQPPQGCPRNSVNICLVDHRSFSTLKGGMSAVSFLHSSFLQAINAVMLWPVHVQKVPQASEHLCPAKLQARCDICCACQSICPFIPTDSGCAQDSISTEVFVAEDCGWLWASRGQPIPDSTFCSRFIESMRMTACVICASR